MMGLTQFFQKWFMSHFENQLFIFSSCVTVTKSGSFSLVTWSQILCSYLTGLFTALEGRQLLAGDSSKVWDLDAGQSLGVSWVCSGGLLFFHEQCNGLSVLLVDGHV